MGKLLGGFAIGFLVGAALYRKCVVENQEVFDGVIKDREEYKKNNEA